MTTLDTKLSSYSLIPRLHSRSWSNPNHLRWEKPQVYGFADVVKREYRSNRELFNLIDFQEVIRREFDYKDWVLKVLK